MARPNHCVTTGGHWAAAAGETHVIIEKKTRKGNKDKCNFMCFSDGFLHGSRERTHGPGTKRVIIETKKLGKATRTDVISRVSLTGFHVFL